MSKEGNTSPDVKVVVVPHVNANDFSVEVLGWNYKDWDYISEGSIICEIETTKAVVEVISENSGYVYSLRGKKTVKVGEPLAYVFSKNDPDQVSLINSLERDEKNIKVTNKARLLLEEHNLNVNDFPDFSIISTDTVIAKLREIQKEKHPRDKNYVSKVLNNLKIDKKSIAIIGEINNAITAIDYLKESYEYNPVAYINDLFDKDNIGGIECLPSAAFVKIVDLGLKNVFICGADKNEIENDISFLKKFKVSFVNVIHPRAVVSRNAILGKCILMGPNVVLGPDVIIGDYTKILNASTVAHHTKVGQFVTISDGSHIGGNVTINNGSYIGIGVNVNKRIEIGENSTIVSGSTVVDHVKANEVHRL